MTNKTVTVRAGTIPARAYEIKIGAGNLAILGEVAKQTLPPAARRAALISNERVYALYGEMVAESLRRAGYDVATWLMGEGERYKSFAVLGRALDFLSSAGIERSDAVIALGGGVVGDLAGFAAAAHLRGISFLQVPTTFLSQIDSSVGGKTGINTRWGKNLVGAFHQPRAVLIDVATHDTLPPRELTAGWCEAVKQGAVGGRDLFVKTTRTLAAKGEGTTPDRQRGAMIELIAAQCAFKASIVAGDEREELGRQDHRSRKVLNFGHTVGHALEAVTNYRRFKHGEAVGCGMLVAGQLSLALGLLADFELESLRSAIRATGRLPRTNDLNSDDLIAALAHDKKSVAGHLKWILLEKLGRARIINGTEVTPRLLRSSLRQVLELKA